MHSILLTFDILSTTFFFGLNLAEVEISWNQLGLEKRRLLSGCSPLPDIHWQYPKPVSLSP